MESGTVLTKLADVLHAIAQGLLVPDIILLLAFIGYALFSIGSIIMEFVKEHRNYQVETPKFLAALMGASDSELPSIIKNSGLLNRQKQALLTVYDYRTLPGDALVALIRKLVNNEETHYARITARNNTAAKIAPMAGLMGTLIPLGPGVAALGSGETATLSSSLLIAFDTTVAGLIVAVVCLAIGKIRSTWYNEYMSMLDAAMATMLQKIENMRDAGQITVQEPTNYAFLFEQGLKKDSSSRKDVNISVGSGSAQGAATTTSAGMPARTPQTGTQAGQGWAAAQAAPARTATPGTPAAGTGAGQAAALNAATYGQPSATSGVSSAPTGASAPRTQGAGRVAPAQTRAIAEQVTGSLRTQPQRTSAITPASTPQATGTPSAARPAGATQPGAAGTAAPTRTAGTTAGAAAGTQPQTSGSSISQSAAQTLAQAHAQAQARAAATTPSTPASGAKTNTAPDSAQNGTNSKGKHASEDDSSKWPFLKK